MITCKISKDVELINSIFTDSAIYKHIIDDGSAKREDFTVATMITDPNIRMLVAYDDATPIGAFMYHRHNYIMWEGHFCVLPHYRGEKAILAAKATLNYMFKETNCKKIIGNIPENNKPALRFIKLVGFTLEGINYKSHMKNGIIYNQYVCGLSKGNLQWEQQ